MSTVALKLIETVEQAGGRFLIDGDRLGIVPRDAAAPVLEDLRTRKLEIIALLNAKIGESFRHWLDLACIRSPRWFTNLSALHREFCRWQSEHRDTQPILSDFRRLLEAADFLIAPIQGVTLVSGLAFKSDKAGVPTPMNRAH